MIATLMMNLAAIPTKVKVALGIALVIVLALTLAYCNGRKEGKAQADLALERANNETILIDGKAREQASDERLADAIRIAETKKELSDVVNSLPDEIPSDHRISLGCERLRRQGTNPATLPSVCGR